MSSRSLCIYSAFSGLVVDLSADSYLYSLYYTTICSVEIVYNSLNGIFDYFHFFCQDEVQRYHL